MAVDKTNWNKRIWDRAVLICFWTMQTIVLLSMIGLSLALLYIYPGQPTTFLFPIFNGLAILVIVIEIVLYKYSSLTPEFYLATNIMKTTFQLGVSTIFVLRVVIPTSFNPDATVRASSNVQVVVMQAIAFILALLLMFATLSYACVILNRSRNARSAAKSISKLESAWRKEQQMGMKKLKNQSTYKHSSGPTFPGRAMVASKTRTLFRLHRQSTSSSFYTIPDFESSGPQPPPLPKKPFSWRQNSNVYYELGEASRGTSVTTPYISRKSWHSLGSLSSEGTQSARSIRTRVRTSDAAKDFTAFRLRLDSHNRYSPERKMSDDLLPYRGTQPLEPRR